MEVFNELMESEVSVIVPHVADVVRFFLEVRPNCVNSVWYSKFYSFFFKLTSDVWYLNAQRVLHVLSACVRSAVTPIWVTLCEWKRSLASPSSSSWRVRWVIHQLFKYLPYVCVCVCGVVEHMRILWVCQKTWLLVLSFLDTKRSVYHW